MLIPLTDVSRRPTRFPLVTAIIIAINALVFVLELAGGEAFVTRWSVIPANIVAGQGWITILTAMFMHGSWSHIIGNMVFLWAFGPEVEDYRHTLTSLTSVHTSVPEIFMVNHLPSAEDAALTQGPEGQQNSEPIF